MEIRTTRRLSILDMAGCPLPLDILSLIRMFSWKEESNQMFSLKEISRRVWDHGNRQATSVGRKGKLISGVYSCDPGINSYQVLKMEHCALDDRGNQWNLEVKYRPRGSKASTEPWISIYDFYPDADVKVKHNYIELTIPSPKEDHEFAVFGTPETKDKKRVQVGVFGKKPMQGKEWEVFVILFDDTMMAFKYVCEREESRGRQLLTTLAGLFVSNSDEVIKIDMTALEKGWEINGSKVKTIKSKDAWNSPENSTDFPHCIFEIAHVDEAKKSFFCGITVSHLDDTAETEVVTFFEEKKEVNPSDQIFKTWHGLTIHEDNVIDFFVFLQMLVFLVGCFTGVGFDPNTQSAGSVAT